MVPDMETLAAMAKKEKWYAAGLAFECTQCGNCCSGPPGYVWLTKEEIAGIAKRLGTKDGRLGKEYVRRVGLRFSLTERADGDCVFLKRENGRTFCGIYEVRPLQCRTWPFWKDNLRSEESWNRANETCPGINRGTHHNFVAIESIRLKKSW
jgi:uncharacterized protein